jgi:hypothetical protein
MSNEQFTPPVPPAPKNFIQKNVWLAALTVAVVVLAVAIFVTQSGSDSNSSPSSNSSAVIEDSQSRNKYDDYYQSVLNASGMANSESKASVLEFGDFVCSLLDDGFSVGDILEEMRKYTTGSMFTSEYAAAVMLGAVTYLCPEYKVLVENYVGQ